MKLAHFTDSLHMCLISGESDGKWTQQTIQLCVTQMAKMKCLSYESYKSFPQLCWHEEERNHGHALPDGLTCHVHICIEADNPHGERERENKQRPLRVPHKALYVCRGDSVMVAPHSIPQCTVCLCQVLFMSFSFMRLSTNSHRYSIYLWSVKWFRNKAVCMHILHFSLLL